MVEPFETAFRRKQTREKILKNVRKNMLGWKYAGKTLLGVDLFTKKINDTTFEIILPQPDKESGKIFLSLWKRRKGLLGKGGFIPRFPKQLTSEKINIKDLPKKLKTIMKSESKIRKLGEIT